MFLSIYYWVVIMSTIDSKIRKISLYKFEEAVKEGIYELLKPGIIDHYKDVREFICREQCNDNDCIRKCNENPVEFYLKYLNARSELNSLDALVEKYGANKDSVKAFLSRIFFGSFIYKDPEENKEEICRKLYNNPEKYGRKIGNEMVSHNPKVVSKALVAYLWLKNICY